MEFEAHPLRSRITFDVSSFRLFGFSAFRLFGFSGSLPGNSSSQISLGSSHLHQVIGPRQREAVLCNPRIMPNHNLIVKSGTSKIERKDVIQEIMTLCTNRIAGEQRSEIDRPTTFPIMRSQNVRIFRISEYIRTCLSDVFLRREISSQKTCPSLFWNIATSQLHESIESEQNGKKWKEMTHCMR
jgi:hypothetical protein